MYSNLQDLPGKLTGNCSNGAGVQLPLHLYTEILADFKYNLSWISKYQNLLFILILRVFYVYFLIVSLC